MAVCGYYSSSAKTVAVTSPTMAAARQTTTNMFKNGNLRAFALETINFGKTFPIYRRGAVFG